VNVLRLAASLLGLGMSVANVSSEGHSEVLAALAQVAHQSATSGSGLSDLLSDPGGWFTSMVNSALVTMGERATSDIVGFMNWLLGSGNIISQTPATLSYANPAVRELTETTRRIAFAGLAGVTAWGGISVIVRPHLRTPYHGAMEIIPRILLSGFMLATSLQWCQFVIDLNNALCDAVGAGPIPGWTSVPEHMPTGGSVLLNLIAMAVYLVMGLLLAGQMLMRLALVDALLVVAPLALLCWALPQTYGWARLWLTTFFGTVFVQAVQVLVLRLGSDLMQRLPEMLNSTAADPLDGGRAWLMTLFLGVAVLHLARKIPRLVPGFPGGFGGAALGFVASRQMNSLFNSGKSKGAK
jgi:hypothetical protein